MVVNKIFMGDNWVLVLHQQVQEQEEERLKLWSQVVLIVEVKQIFSQLETHQQTKL